MDPQVLMDVAVTVTKLKMYPYFDVAHYLLMCLSVRDDQQPPQHSQQQSAGAATPIFSRKHPLSCWVACIMTCFAGSIISNLILGEPCIAPLKNHRDIITASIVWYLVFYSPFDLVYKALRLRPVKMVVGGLKETQRAHKIYHGVTYTAKLYPQSYIVIVLIGAIKGSGSTLLKGFTRLVRGVWVPGSNELLQPSFTTKASLVAAIIFTLEKYHFIVAPHAMIYFGVVLFFVYFKLSSLFLGVHDPFMPFENLFCAVFMGGMWDALRRAVQREPGKGDRQNTELNNEIIKSKDEKKKD